MEDEEAPFEQSISGEVLSWVRTPKAGPSTQKTHPCEKCVPILKDILHLADQPGQKLYLDGACANLHQLQKHYTAEQRDVERASFVKSCIFLCQGIPSPVGRLERSSQPHGGFSSTRPFSTVRSQTKSPSVGRPFIVEKSLQIT